MMGSENNRNNEEFSFRQTQQYDFSAAYEEQAPEDWSL